jgi:hypothetical protein
MTAEQRLDLFKVVIVHITIENLEIGSTEAVFSINLDCENMTVEEIETLIKFLNRGNEDEVKNNG